MYDLALSVCFVCLGLWRTLTPGPRFITKPYFDDLRSSILFSNSSFMNTFVRITLGAAIFIRPSFRAHFSAFSLLASMWMDDYQYPEEAPENREEYEDRTNRQLVMDLVIGILLGRLVYSTPCEFSYLSVAQTLFGCHLYWIGFFGKTDFDEVFWFPNGFPRQIRDGDPDLDQLDQITCPDYRYRIIQWIGFALMADERLIYCFSFCVCSFLVKYSIARHRMAVRYNPNTFGRLNALFFYR